MKNLMTLLFHDLYRGDPSESGFSGPAADRYKLSLENFDRQLEPVLRERRDGPVLVTGPEEPQGLHPFAITVDDGGISYHGLLADRLEAAGWRGHCLITTGCIGRRGFLHPHHIRELAERGHVIGSHTVSHPSWINRGPWKAMVEEWSRSRQDLEDLLGKRVTVGSVPGGYYSDRVARAAAAAGLKVLFTSEPERRPRRVGGCRVIGRYTLRRDSPPDLAGRLVRQEPAALLREWLAWNGKKVLKNSLGPGYQRLSLWLSRAG